MAGWLAVQTMGLEQQTTQAQDKWSQITRGTSQTVWRSKDICRQVTRPWVISLKNHKMRNWRRIWRTVEVQKIMRWWDWEGREGSESRADLATEHRTAGWQRLEICETQQREQRSREFSDPGRVTGFDWIILKLTAVNCNTWCTRNTGNWTNRQSKRVLPLPVTVQTHRASDWDCHMMWMISRLFDSRDLSLNVADCGNKSSLRSAWVPRMQWAPLWELRKAAEAGCCW